MRVLPRSVRSFLKPQDLHDAWSLSHVKASPPRDLPLCCAAIPNSQGVPDYLAYCVAGAATSSLATRPPGLASFAAVLAAAEAALSEAAGLWRQVSV